VTAGPVGHDGEIEALVVDRYLESLLARRPADAAGVPPDLDAAAQALRLALPRYHPSFRFEEALAGRLSALARGLSRGELLELPFPGGADLTDEARAGLSRPVVIGGVLTSAAISLAGAAIVAWRWNRPGDPMSRAVRAVSRTRLI
jgi:hypothetical protein